MIKDSCKYFIPPGILDWIIVLKKMHYRFTLVIELVMIDTDRNV